MSTLASRCDLNFTGTSQTRGSAYAKQGRVEIEHFSEQAFHGSVRGSGRNRYAVTITVPDEDDPEYGDAIFGSCECPHFDRSGAVCKHLWAFILELDAAGRTQDLPGSGDLDLYEPSLRDLSGLDEFDSFGDDGDGAEVVGTGAPGFPERDRIERRAAWRFLSVSAPLHRPAPRTLHFVAQHASNGLWTVALYDSSSGAADSSDSIRRVLSNGIPDEQGLSAEDRAALIALIGCEETASVRDYRSSYFGHGQPIQYVFSDRLASLLLPVIASTDRLYWCPTVRMPAKLDIGELTPLRWHGDRPLSLTFRLSPAPDDTAESAARQEQMKETAGRRIVPTAGGWQLAVELHGDDAPELADVERVGSSGIAIAENRIHRVEPSVHARLAERLRVDGPLRIEENAIDEFIEFAAPLDLPGLEWPESLGWSVVSAKPTGRISFQKPRHLTPRTMVWSDLAYDYTYALDSDRFVAAAAEEHEPRRASIPYQYPHRVLVDRETKRIQRRDFDAEAALHAEIFDAGLSTMSKGNRHEADFQIKRKSMASAVASLLDRGWNVEADGIRYASASSHSLSVKSGIDWFDLEGSVVFDDVEVPLPALLAALERDDDMIALGDGRHGLLPTEWLNRVARVAGFGRTEEDGIRFAPHQALLLDALLDSRGEVERDAVFAKACKRLGQTRKRKRKRVRAPKGLDAELRPYQNEGLAWLVHMAETGLGACLADDMGLGKTVQALGLLASRVESRTQDEERLPSIAVVPASLVHNWLAEAKRFTPNLRLLDYTGPKRADVRDVLRDADLIVTTYGVLRRDIEKIVDQRFDTVILDEAQAIKNATTQASKATRLLRAECRVALSGTPVENHLGELWALFDFLNPGLLGDARRGLRSLDQASPEAIEVISRGVGPFILRRTKGEVLPDLPPKTEQTLYCDLEGKQKKTYAQLRDHYRQSLLRRVDREGMNKSKIQVLEAILRLRQAACHPGLIDPKRARDGSAKLDLLMESLEQTIEEGHKILVFSQFTSLLALVRGHLDAKGIVYESLDGRTRNRGARVTRFQEDPACPVFLISLKAGGHGLNLTAADYAFLLDPWWNPAAEAQAIDRMHRIGQTRPVFAYRLVARDTIEERILELQEQKRELAHAVIAGARSHLKEMTRDDLERLLA